MTLNPNFRYADGYSLREIKAANAAFKPISEADRYRLVKAAKCPTANLKPKTAFELPTQAPDDLILPPTVEPETPEGQPAARTIIQYRDWSDEYRIRTKVETTVGTRPPEQNGPRITQTLTPRAVRKIAESCAYVASKHGGYSTFLTLTFSEQQRWRINVPSGNYCDLATRKICKPSTIQNEVSRFCEGLTKMWERGWHAEFTIHGRRLACVDTFRINYGERIQCINSKGDAEHVTQGEGSNSGPLFYCWVAEVPDNENGEPNPHVHLLLRWQVPFVMFSAWAKRIEQLWGCGFAHLEKIKDGEAAAAYMMKAAGYLCKAQGKDDQGPVRGNRYGISEAARAPDWETLSESQLHVMGRLIAEVNDHITYKYGAQYQLRKRLRENLDAAPKNSKVRHIIGQQLERVRNQIKKIPIVASKYQIIIKGKQAFDTLILWARTPARWGAELCEWLPEKGENEEWRPGQRPDSHWLARFLKNLYWRRSLRHMPPAGWEDIEFMQCIEEYETWSKVAPNASQSLHESAV